MRVVTMPNEQSIGCLDIALRRRRHYFERVRMTTTGASFMDNQHTKAITHDIT